MAAKEAGRRVSYDKVWGLLLVLTCAFPLRYGGDGYLWHLVQRSESWVVTAWLLAGSLAGVVAVVQGFAAVRGRWRHFANFLLGVVTLALPIFSDRIWTEFPTANPAFLPLSGFGTVGWVMLLGIGAVYAGSGIRIVRPSQIVGQALGGLGAFLLLVFAFLPGEAGPETSFGWTYLSLFEDVGANWRVLVPFGLVVAAILCGVLNILRSEREVKLAKLTRVLLVAGLLFWIMLPFLERVGDEGTRLAAHLPVAWGALRFLAPLFLSLDGCLAFLAITITRSNE